MLDRECPPAWQGYKALLSSPWYLNLGKFADEAWVHYYGVEPLGFNATPEQIKLVIGGEVGPRMFSPQALCSPTQTWHVVPVRDLSLLLLKWLLVWRASTKTTIE